MAEYKVLMVDDDELVREMLEDWLRGAGYSAIGAANGSEWLQAVSEYDPDVVITDLSMPVMDGFEFIRPVSINIPYTQELLDKADDDVSQLKFQFYDDSVTPGRWVDLPVDRLSNGIRVSVDHLTIFAVVASEETVGANSVVEVTGEFETASLLLSSLYENSVALTSGDLTTVELLVDSGGNPINSVGTRVTFPPDLVEIVEVRTRGSICDQGLSVPVNDQGEVQVNCQISGDGYAGASAVVATFVLRAKSGRTRHAVLRP